MMQYFLSLGFEFKSWISKFQDFIIHKHVFLFNKQFRYIYIDNKLEWEVSDKKMNVIFYLWALGKDDREANKIFSLFTREILQIIDINWSG